MLISSNCWPYKHIPQKNPFLLVVGVDHRTELFTLQSSCDRKSPCPNMTRRFSQRTNCPFSSGISLDFPMIFPLIGICRFPIATFDHLRLSYYPWSASSFMLPASRTSQGPNGEWSSENHMVLMDISMIYQWYPTGNMISYIKIT